MKTLILTTLWAAVLCATGLSNQAFGQNRRLQQLLEGASRVDCSFSTLTTSDWGEDETSAAVTPAEFELAFYDINTDEGTAEAEGRFGASFVVVRFTYVYLHFMQMFSAGPLYVTTILAHETTEGRFKAVHTRHEYSPTIIPGFTSRPETYIGDCAVSE